MEAWKKMIFALFLALFLLRAGADEGSENADTESGDSSLRIELEQIKSKISVLESNIQEKNKELKSKDERILQLERNIQEKLDSFATLQHEMEFLQKKGTVAAEEQVGKAYARNRELEKQVEQLKKEVEMQNKKKDILEARADEADKKVSELSSQVESLQKVNEEQKNWIRKAERALQVAEEEMMKAKLEATSKASQLMEAHGAWLPPWLASHFVQLQSYVAQHWHERGKPAFSIAYQKALEKSEQTKRWAEPHLETVKTKLVPSLKEQWVTCKASVDPYIQLVTARTFEVFETSKTVVIPYIVKVQETTVPYLQEAKMISKPYVEQIAATAKPHVDNARIVLIPYKKKVVQFSGKYLKSVTSYHRQIQKTVQNNLKKHELTKPMASKEMAWFTASFLFALLLFVLYTIVASIFSKNTEKPIRSAQSNHGHRKHKRRHTDK